MTLSEGVLTTGIAAAAFAATNVDDLLVLMAYFASPSFRAREIVAGQFLGMSLLALASLILAFFAGAALPAGSLRYLGLIPLFFGAWALRYVLKGAPCENVNDATMRGRGRSRVTRALSVAAVTLANGGDNIGVYGPLFSTRPPFQVAWILGVFGVMTALWCGIGALLVRHPILGRPIRRWGRVALPWVLVALGVFILFGH